MIPIIGVLALQGDFEAHGRALSIAGAEPRLVRLPGELEGVSGLIVPGGESTALLRLMREYRLDEAVRRLAGSGGALFGTCAGSILLARTVTSPSQWSLGLLDISIARNAYGRQIDSFETRLTEVDPGVLSVGGPGGPEPDRSSLPALFIRAPRILAVGPAIQVLARHEGEPVLVRQENLLASTFHPEMTGDTRIHRYFLEMARAGVESSPGRG